VAHITPASFRAPINVIGSEFPCQDKEWWTPGIQEGPPPSYLFSKFV
jgi:hypothetical protein